jgi:hypothetical protein
MASKYLDLRIPISIIGGFAEFIIIQAARRGGSAGRAKLLYK